MNVLNLVAGLTGFVIVCLAFFGVGRWVRRLAQLPVGSWSVTIGLGLAAVLTIGGVLNLLRLTYPAAFTIILIIGLLATALEWRAAGSRMLQTTFWPGNPAECRHLIAWFLVIVILLGYTSATQLAPRLYNITDDFQKYFPHAVREIETGTLFGSPLNALGSESLGGQAFLQGFILSYFPLQFINAADAFFCFGLCVLLIGGISLGRPRGRIATLAGMLAVFFIHPQFVNISALFSVSAVLMTLMLLHVDEREVQSNSTRRAGRAAAMGLCYAAAFSLKPTVLGFLGLLFLLSTTAEYIAERNWRRVSVGALWTLLWSGIFIAPWVLLYATYFLFALTHSSPVPTTQVYPAWNFDFLSIRSMDQGATPFAYTSLAMGLGICAIAAAYHAMRRAKLSQRLMPLMLAAVACAGAVDYFVAILVGYRLIGAEAMLRYTTPVLIAVVPLVLVFTAILWDAPAQIMRRPIGTATSVVSAAILVGLFLPATVDRIKLQIMQGTSLSYIRLFGPKVPSEITTYEEATFDGRLEEEIRAFQDTIPPNETVLTWISPSFLLDYRRNPIIDLNEGGLGASWSVIPKTSYVLWQFAGLGVRSPPELRYGATTAGGYSTQFLTRALDTYAALASLAKAPETEILEEEDGMIAMHLRGDDKVQ